MNMSRPYTTALLALAALSAALTSGCVRNAMSEDHAAKSTTGPTPYSADHVRVQMSGAPAEEPPPTF
jgi:hypothetical protein